MTRRSPCPLRPEHVQITGESNGWNLWCANCPRKPTVFGYGKCDMSSDGRIEGMQPGKEVTPATIAQQLSAECNRG